MGTTQAKIEELFRVVRLDELCAALGLPKKFVVRLGLLGELPRLKIGNAYYYRVDRVKEAVERLIRR